MKTRIVIVALVGLVTSATAIAQNTNSSTTTPRPTTTATKPSPTPAKRAASTAKPAATATTPKAQATKPKPATAATTPSAPVDVVAAFNALLDGIRHADVKAVTNVYWNSPQLILFNNNGTVTRGWDQMRKNRESSYPDLKDVKLEVRDVAVNMLGRDGAVVTCLWTQSQTFKGTPETATGRMTLVFKRVGKDWKAVHLHTSPDRPDPSRILPSEQSSPSPTPTPAATPPPTQ